MKIVASLKNSGLLLKGVSETVQNKAKKQEGGFLSILLDTLGSSLLGNMLEGKGINRVGEGIIRAVYGSKNLKSRTFDLKKRLILLHLLTKFEIKKYYQTEPRLNWVYSRNNLPKKIKDGAYLRILDECSDVGTLWIALYAVNNNVTYFYSFDVEHIPKEIEKFINGFTIKRNFIEYKHILK